MPTAASCRNRSPRRVVSKHADGIEGLGFISAGPWDFIGHAEVPETKLDGRIARNIDRDDMVKNTMNIFISTTVQCARCHDHKFDAVNMTDYYRMQAASPRSTEQIANTTPTR